MSRSFRSKQRWFWFPCFSQSFPIFFLRLRLDRLGSPGHRYLERPALEVSGRQGGEASQGAKLEKNLWKSVGFLGIFMDDFYGFFGILMESRRRFLGMLVMIDDDLYGILWIYWDL